MYRKPSSQLTIDDFKLPFEGKLRADNRWVRMTELIPWDEIEQEYAKLFENDIGNVAKPARMALGALIIKEKCGYSDIETVEQIKENPSPQSQKSTRSWFTARICFTSVATRAYPPAGR